MPRTRHLMALLVSLLCTPLGAATYQLDPDHTLTHFEIGYFWLFTQRGQFDRARGTLVYDVERHSGSLDVTIDAASLDTGYDERDTDLKVTGWFDVDRHPAITFRSQRFIFEQDPLTAIEGELTMLGVTVQAGDRADRVRNACGYRQATLLGRGQQHTPAFPLRDARPACPLSAMKSDCVSGRRQR